MIGPSFEVSLLKAASAEPAAVDAALDALAGADLVTPRAGSPVPPSGSSRRSCIRTSSWPVARNYTPAWVRPRGPGRGRPRESRATGGSRPPLGPRRRQAARRPVPGGGRRLGRRHVCQRGRDPALSAGPRRARALRRAGRGHRDRGGAACGPGADGRSPRPDRTAGGRARASTRSSRPDTARRGTRRRERGSFARWGGCTGTRAPGARARLLRGRARPARRPPRHIEQAHLYQEMGRLAFRSGDTAGRRVGRARLADAERARPRPAPTPPVRGSGNAAVHATTRSASRSRAGPPRRGGGAHRAQRRPGRGARSAAGSLPRLYQPQRALQLARSAAGASRPATAGSRWRRRWATSASSRASTRTSRWPTARSPTAARRRVSRPPTRPSRWTAGWGCSTTWRCPSSCSGQIHQCHGDHALAFASYEEALGLAEQVGEPQLLFPCYDGLATLHLDAGDQARRKSFHRQSAGGLRTRGARARRADGAAVPLLTRLDDKEIPYVDRPAPRSPR